MGLERLWAPHEQHSPGFSPGVPIAASLGNFPLWTVEQGGASRRGECLQRPHLQASGSCFPLCSNTYAIWSSGCSL